MLGLPATVTPPAMQLDKGRPGPSSASKRARVVSPAGAAVPIKGVAALMALQCYMSTDDEGDSSGSDDDAPAQGATQGNPGKRPATSTTVLRDNWHGDECSSDDDDTPLSQWSKRLKVSNWGSACVRRRSGGAFDL